MNWSVSGLGWSFGQHLSTNVPRGATICQNRAPLNPPADPNGRIVVGRQSTGYNSKIFAISSMAI
jgi:hypothetical protein